MEPFNTPAPTVIVGEIVAGAAAKARKQLEKLITDVNKSSFDIGDLLHTIKKNGYYDGYTTFQEYTATLDIKQRKLQYLRRIAEVMETVGISREKYEPLGIAKLREITSLKPEESWADPETGKSIPMREFIIGFVEKGSEMDLEAIKLHVRTLKGFTGENDLVCMHLWFKRVTRDNVIQPAVELTRNAIGSVGKDDEGVSIDASESACVEAWAVEFLNNPANSVLPEGIA